MNVVLAWVKKNVFIVVFVVLMVVALVALPIVSANLNSGVQEEVKTRARNASDLKELTTQVGGIPGVEVTDAIVNQSLLDQYERAASAISEDARRVVDAAIEHNRKGRGVLMPQLLPEPPMTEAQVLPEEFHALLIAAYDELIDEVGMGLPPDEDFIQDELDPVEARIRTNTFLKELTDPLDPDEQAELQTQLAAERVALYAEAAAKILIYGSADFLNIPGFNLGDVPSLDQVYHWQWQLWITQDILHALHDANRDDYTVLGGPVKRVLWILPDAMPHGVAAVPEGSGSRRGGGSSGGGAPTAPADPKKPVPLDFGKTFTGRTTNPLYDVHMVSVGLVVDSNRIPEVLDALGRQNFMTVTNLNVTPRDPYADVRDGYLYGRVPVSMLELEVETIWLRQWTSQFMPASLRRALGIPDDSTTTG